ncbi:MAG TPA: HAMP domain-containing sensor histidine kinase [Acidimicrobiales bacterium]|nr:HAMP domain-containing sensor histidine kinase [Acidimicrobiales bacterium]
MRRSIERRHAAGVALVATSLGMAAFVLVCIVINSVLLGRLDSQVDTRLNQQLSVVKRVANSAGDSGTALNGLSKDQDRDDVPIYLWRVGHDGVAHALEIGSPRLPTTAWSLGARTETVGQSTFRFTAVHFRNGWLVAGESLAEVARVGSSLFDVEIAAGAVLLVLMYLAAFFVGVRAMAPVALTRRRQAEFTSDASHELRTPLSVIEAEVDLALSRPRDAESYRGALRRVGNEGHRLHRIVEDLLWLARSDEARLVAGPSATCDLVEVAGAAVSRFEPLASRNGVSLEFVGSPVAATVQADAESIDRLVGVLVDNACKFAGPGGQVRVSVEVIAHRRVLTVEDSGPGIPIHERDVVFDRFHRTDSSTAGTGLGLAIADAIMTSTHAHRTVSESSLGGALFEVSWRFVS